MKLNELTNRELQVLQLVVEGKQNKEIAHALCISENTVEQHLRSIFRKLVVSNRVEASRLFWQYQKEAQVQDNGNPL